MRRPRTRAGIQFAEPPWNERSVEWQILDQQVPADHPARAVVEAMKQLDLTPLCNNIVRCVNFPGEGGIARGGKLG